MIALTGTLAVRIAFAALVALGVLAALACSGGGSDSTRVAERVGSSSGIPTGPAVAVPNGYASPGDHVPSTGAWVPDNGQPTLVFVDAIW